MKKFCAEENGNGSEPTEKHASDETGIVQAESPNDCGSEPSAEKRIKRIPHLNFRPLLFCALGIAFGIFLYLKIRFGGLAASDFLFIGVVLFFAIRPYGWKRIFAVLTCFIMFAGIGVLAIHLYTRQFDDSLPSGEYEVVGTVESFTMDARDKSIVLTDLKLNGKSKGGKLSANVSDEHIRAGDVVRFTANITRSDMPDRGNDYREYLYVNGIRYTANNIETEKIGTSSNVFLLLNTKIYDVLHLHLPKDEADVAYALLTGNSSGMDGTLLQAIRNGGIAHIFAVSGLHIGILFGAVSLLFKPLLRRKACLPALVAAVFYCALCGFTVSSVRAAVMCGVLSFGRAFGRKTDFLNSLSVAAVFVLTLFPAQWLSAGFRLSFGACAGLALFSGSLRRAFRKLPSFLGGYLAANLSVQMVTFPILIDCFGYFSVWGTLLNFFLIPLLPVLFLGLFLCMIFALMIPPAAAFFLFFPQGMISLLIYVFSVADFSMALTGFAFGAASAVWLSGMLLLSPRLRLRPLARGVAAGIVCILFGMTMIYENAVFYGCKLTAYESGDSAAALLRTKDAAVLVIDGEISLKRCNDFLARNYAGKLDAVVILAADELRAINVGAFLSATCLYAREEIETGLQKTEIIFTQTFTIGGMVFRYESAEKMTVTAEGSVVELDLNHGEALGADLFVGKGSGGLKFFLNYGIIKAV